MSTVINQDDVLSAVREKIYGGSCHGVTKSEWKEFQQLLLSVKPNDSESKTVFPDFISENGFIEHFHVTSGISSRKGYDITKEESKMQQSHKDFMKASKYSTRVQMPESKTIVDICSKRLHTKSLNKIVPILQEILESYEQYEWNPDTIAEYKRKETEQIKQNEDVIADVISKSYKLHFYRKNR